MKTILFAVHDQKAEIYTAPFSCKTPAEGKRIFSDCVNEPSHAFARNPADYTLCEVGTYEDTSGIINPTLPVIYMGNGLSYIKTEEVKNIQLQEVEK